jgi:FMN reductase
MTTRTIAVVSAGLGVPSSTRLLADRLTASVVARLRDEGVEVVVERVEVREVARDVTNSLLTGSPSPDLRSALDAVTGADGIIAVTPVFNGSYSGLFKSFLDVLEPGALDGVPVLIAATGGSERHSLVLDHALRPLFSYLHAVVVPTGVFAASSDWGAGSEGGRALESRVERAAGELADLVARSTRSSAADPFALGTDFAALLGGAAAGHR